MSAPATEAEQLLFSFVEQFASLAMQLLDSKHPQTHRLAFENGDLLFITLIKETAKPEETKA